ncbi:MAG: hypothetical protein IPN88_19295 [Bacteroidetes bacterium]|nr:hypothetical protein [Bacteroidota bacterium]
MIQISTITPTTYPWNGVYFNGNPVTITAIPNPGYTFDHWRSNVVLSSNNTNQSVTYNFTSVMRSRVTYRCICKSAISFQRIEFPQAIHYMKQVIG